MALALTRVFGDHLRASRPAAAEVRPLPTTIAVLALDREDGRPRDLDALRGWPRVLVLNRPGADTRRDRLLEDYETRDGYDREEYPPAVGRGKGKGLERGRNPRGWKADVEYVGNSENRSHGSRLGTKLKRFCNGTRSRFVFY